MNLISKKDLLAVTGISYGQLYRWKRERLIPEEWFIKQSSYTGQETFFPREQILSRVQSILDLKDDHSLDELAKLFSPESSVVVISPNELKAIEGISKELIPLLPELLGREQFDFFDAAFVSAVWETAKKAGISMQQASDLIQRSAVTASKKKGGDAICTIFFSDGEYHTVFSQKNAQLVFDSGIEVVEQILVGEAAEQLKLKNRFVNKKFKGDGNDD
jgi:hypothetical protein